MGTTTSKPHALHATGRRAPGKPPKLDAESTGQEAPTPTYEHPSPIRVYSTRRKPSNTRTVKPQADEENADAMGHAPPSALPARDLGA